jgi:(+)-trans-carveol dehydrogenase
VTEFDRLDIVPANAGIVSFGESVDLEEQQWRDMIDPTLTGSWHAAKAYSPGPIVLTSSILGLITFPNVSHYAAAKQGVIGLMKNLALELAPNMIRVNTVNPTNVDTPMVMNDATRRLFDPVTACRPTSSSPRSAGRSTRCRSRGSTARHLQRAAVPRIR